MVIVKQMCVVETELFLFLQSFYSWCAIKCFCYFILKKGLKGTKILKVCLFGGIRVMVFNTTFNNISVTALLWRSFLFVKETGVPEQNH
jgi:hypothetical protein